MVLFMQDIHMLLRLWMYHFIYFSQCRGRKYFFASKVRNGRFRYGSFFVLESFIWHSKTNTSPYFGCYVDNFILGFYVLHSNSFILLSDLLVNSPILCPVLSNQLDIEWVTLSLGLHFHRWLKFSGPLVINSISDYDFFHLCSYLTK